MTKEEKMKVIVTAGPTYEPLDPVRFIGNRSSGKQGYAIAEALRDKGFDVTLISGPTALNDPKGLTTIRIETAQEMLEATQSALPADIAICAAAVSDWGPQEPQDHKIKKRGDNSPLTLTLKQNPDILHTIAHHQHRPKLVIGFAAETQNLQDNARAKLSKKGCDWIVANLVGQNSRKTFGEDENQVYLITSSKSDEWPHMRKTAVAEKLAEEIEKHINTLQDAPDT